MPLTNEQHEEIERSINATIHELVFAQQHIDQDDFDDASTLLVQCQMNLDRLNEIIVAHTTA
jgi:hypothetical protein